MQRELGEMWELGSICMFLEEFGQMIDRIPRFCPRVRLGIRYVPLACLHLHRGQTFV